jgi:hypothetical protein
MTHKAITTGLEEYESSLIKSINQYRWALFFCLAVLFIVSIVLIAIMIERSILIKQVEMLHTSYDSLKSNMVQ